MLLTSYGRIKMHLVINNSVFSFHKTCESQEVILVQLLHVQYPIVRILFHFDTLFKFSKMIIRVTEEIFVAISYYLPKLGFVTKIVDRPGKFLEISTLDGLLKLRITIQLDHFFRTNIFYVSSTNT